MSPATNQRDTAIGCAFCGININCPHRGPKPVTAAPMSSLPGLHPLTARPGRAADHAEPIIIPIDRGGAWLMKASRT